MELSAYIFFIVFLPLLLFGSLAMSWLINKNQYANKRIIAKGESSQAQILSGQQTGRRENFTEMHFVLQLLREGQTPDATSVVSAITLVPPMDVPRVQVGAVVPVKIDPTNPKKVAIDMAALASTPMAAQGMMGMQPGVQQQGMMGMQPGVQQPGVATCSTCRQQVPPGSPVCPHCGTQILR